MLRTLLIALGLLTGVFVSRHAPAETADEAIARANAAVQAAAPRAQADPSHPAFHVAAPAQWMNDPNGPIYYHGFYHLFYQLHPFSDEDGPKYWGHVRSRDLVKWEHLPVAIAPANDQGEQAIWSGCCTINGLGQPMIFYTSIGLGKSAFDQAAQWAAIGDDQLIHWQKSPANPVLSDAVNNTKIYDWRDPFVFQAGKRTFLVTGGHLARDRQAAATIYEAENAGLTQWKCRGPLFTLPDPATPTVECPNFFDLDHQWVLFVSPYGKVQYFTGQFDADICRFAARTNGVVDYGSFYAPNTLQASAGRRLVWGWINGFPRGHGWNGCLSLPRQLSLSPEGQLLQAPAPELRQLRGKLAEWRPRRLPAGAQSFNLPATNQLEIQADFTVLPAMQISLAINGGPGDAAPVTVGFDGTNLVVMDTKAPLAIANGKHKLELRIFIDRSVLEVFANDTVCVTKVIPTLGTAPVLSLRAGDAGAGATDIRAWPMKSIW